MERDESVQTALFSALTSLAGCQTTNTCTTYRSPEVLPVQVV